MTIIDATRNLINYFTENDIYNPQEDFIKVVTISESEDLDQAIVLKALESLEEEGLVSELTKEDGETLAYVLKKPLVEYSQSLELNFNTIQSLANIVNAFCDDLGIQKGKINPLNITEGDIINLLVIIETLKQQIGNEDEDDDE